MFQSRDLSPRLRVTPEERKQEDKSIGSYILVIMQFTRPPTPSSRSMRALRGGLSINALTQTEGDKKEEVFETIGNYTGCYEVGAG